MPEPLPEPRRSARDEEVGATPTPSELHELKKTFARKPSSTLARDPRIPSVDDVLTGEAAAEQQAINKAGAEAAKSQLPAYKRRDELIAKLARGEDLSSEESSFLATLRAKEQNRTKL